MINTDQLILGTRGSRLALAQATQIQALLQKHFPTIDISVKVISTEGDIDRTTPLSAFGGRGAFVRAIEQALIDNEIDVAVHSLKDLPSCLPDGLMLGATPFRENPHDVLVSASGLKLSQLPPGSVVASGSDRRVRQIANHRPDLVFTGIRGNVETRLQKLETGSIDGVILAAAGLIRLGFRDRITETIDTDIVVPAAGQGAIGLECRTGDMATRELLDSIDDNAIRVCADAERAFIAELGFGCHEPIGAYARAESGMITFTGYVYLQETNRELRATINVSYENAEEAARELACSFRTNAEIPEES